LLPDMPETQKLNAIRPKHAVLFAGEDLIAGTAVRGRRSCWLTAFTNNRGGISLTKKVPNLSRR